MQGFAIQREIRNSRDASAIVASCAWERIPALLVDTAQDVPQGFTPCGTVTWLELVLGRTVKPDYFPAFAHALVKRKVWVQDEWPPEGVHTKPADQYKRYEGHLAGATAFPGPHLCSEPLQFTNEWRYYVSHGLVLGAYWYKGESETDAPVLPIDIPAGWCGTLDLGMTERGLTLIEAHHPMACGWYGDLKAPEYLKWLHKGWEYICNAH